MLHRESLQLSSILVVLKVKTLPGPHKSDDSCRDSRCSIVNPYNCHQKWWFSMPRGSREPRRVPGGSPEGPRGAPGEAQDPPRAPLERPKVAQGSPKGRPKSPRSSQKHPPEGKMEPEMLPRSIFKPNLVQNHIRKRFSIDFSWIFHQNR